MPTLNENEIRLKVLKLKESVTMIGWFGELVSFVSLMISGLMINHNHELTKFVMHNLGVKDDHIFEPLSHYLMKFAVLSYVMSMISIFVCTLLIIGTKKGCYVMLFPWLFFNGMLMTIAVQSSAYIVITIFFVDFALGFWLLIILLTGLYLSYQMFHTVLMLFKYGYMENDYQRVLTSDRLELGDTHHNSGSVPYQILHV